MIVYRDRKLTGRTANVRWPSAIAGMADVVRIETEQGALIWGGSPLVRPEISPEAWIDLPELFDGGDWQMAVYGELDVTRLWRAAPGMPVHLVTDSRGRLWQVPAVLDPKGQVALSLPVGVIDFESVAGVPMPVYGRKPTAVQKRLIHAATTARELMASHGPMGLPMEPMAALACTLLAAGQHASEIVIALSDQIDDRLISRTCLAAAGEPVEEQME